MSILLHLDRLLNHQLELNIDPFTIAAVGLSAASSISQIISGNKTKREAEADIDGYDRQELNNEAENILKVRTEAQDFKANEYDQTFANALDILQTSGSFGNVSSLINQNTQAKQTIATDIQSQRNRIDQAKLQEQQSIRSITETRQSQDLAGLGAKAGYGQQQAQQGFAGLAQTGVTALSAAAPKPGATTATSGTTTSPQGSVEIGALQGGNQGDFANIPEAILDHPLYDGTNESATYLKSYLGI